jgi:CheY-like chemotaxis protein
MEDDWGRADPAPRATVEVAHPTQGKLRMAISSHSGARATCPVLVVDDVDATRRGLAELLRLRGYAAHEAKNGAEGIEVLREHPDTCIVVLDLSMPGTNGFWFREQQLMEPALAHVPVIVFTGSANVAGLHRLGVADVLLKPFSVDDLFEAIERRCAAASQQFTQP